jgi:DNA-binding transcriptional ArsR family regulator
MPSPPPESSTDALFAALAHAARRRILDLLVMRPGMTVKAVASHFEISRIAVMKHLAALEAAGLIISEKEGRERRLYFNPIPIQQIYDRWTDQYSSFWAGRLVDIQTRVQEAAAEKGAKRA